MIQKMWFKSRPFDLLLAFCRIVVQQYGINYNTHLFHKQTYCNVASRSTSWLVAHPRIFKLFMKGKFYAYFHLLWPLDKRVQTWIVDRSTARNFMVMCNLLIAISDHQAHGHNIEHLFCVAKQFFHECKHITQNAN